MLTEKPWRIEAVLQFCGAQMICFCLGGLIMALLEKTGLPAFKLPDGFGAVLIGTLSFQGAAWVLMGVFLWQHQVNWRDFFGLRTPQWVRSLGLAVIVIVVLVPVLSLLQSASSWLISQFGWHPEDQTAVQLVENAKSLGAQIYLGVFAVVLAPVAEEFIFRGMLFPFLTQMGLPRLAWFGVSGLFALIHLNVISFLPLFIFALALTWLYQKTDNLFAPIAAHSLFNGVNLAVLLAGWHTPVT